MKNKFIYPTKRNLAISFILAQAFPFVILYYLEALASPLPWIWFELYIISVLLLWQPKPEIDMDEREKLLFYKSKSKMLDIATPLACIPIVIVCFSPEYNIWDLILIGSLPAYLIFLFFTIQFKMRVGYFKPE